MNKEIIKRYSIWIGIMAGIWIVGTLLHLLREIL